MTHDLFVMYGITFCGEQYKEIFDDKTTLGTRKISCNNEVASLSSLIIGNLFEADLKIRESF